ncbi:MAG: hypothetical protein HDQ88_08745 [Clostridia bacterium]|nr:hypothetical protein [Clostridia bacterium]
MTIPSPFFKDVPSIGDLEVEQVLEEYHVLLLFTCLDKHGNRYLCVCYNIHLHQDWLVVPVTTETLVSLLRNEMMIRQALAQVDKNAIAVTLDYETRKETYKELRHDSDELKELIRTLKELDVPMDATPTDDGDQESFEEYIEKLEKEAQ